MAILVSMIRAWNNGISGIRDLTTTRDSGNVATREAGFADAGWIEKENDIRDINEISSGRMGNSSAKEAGIRDQEPPSLPPFQALFYVGIPPDETEPWLCFDIDEYLDTWRK